MEWHNPLVGILLFLFVVAASVTLTLLFEKWRERVREKRLEKVVEEFAPPLPKGVQLEGKGVEGLELLAAGYRKVGDYSRANYIYFWLYRESGKLEYLEEIAQTYLEGGFLEKGKEICFQILQRRPRSPGAWRILTEIGVKLRDLDLLLDLLESYEAVGDRSPDFYYLLWQVVKLGGYSPQLEVRFGTLEKIVEQFSPLKRSYLFYQLNREPEKGYKLLERDPYSYLDTYFHRSDIPISLPFFPVLKIKGVINFPVIPPPSLPFKLKLLLQLPPNSARLFFLYQCRRCGRRFPFYLEKCPKCGLLFGLNPILEIGEPFLPATPESFQI